MQHHFQRADGQHGQRVLTHGLRNAEERKQRLTEHQHAHADEHGKADCQLHVTPGTELAQGNVAAPDGAADHHRAGGAKPHHRNARQFLDGFDDGDRRIRARAYVAEDRAVQQVAQRPHALVEHGRHADLRKAADKTARNAGKAAWPCAKQRLFCDACAVNHQRTDDGGGQRSNGRALNAQRRKAAQAENQKRIERDIYSDGNQRADERDHHVAGALQQRAAAARERQKRIAERDDAQIGSAQRDGLLI